MKATPGQIAMLRAIQGAMAHCNDDTLCPEATRVPDSCFYSNEDCDCLNAIAKGIEAYEAIRATEVSQTTVASP